MADSSSHASEASELNSQGVESASNMARRVLEMPDWAKVEEDYLKSVRNGRHPISFKRKGELWYHCDTTNQRLARVSKGHKLAHVLDENKYYASEDGGGGGLSGQELLELARGSSLDAASTDSPSLTQSLSSAGSKAGSRQTTARATPANPTTSVRSPVRMSEKDQRLIDAVMGPRGSSHSPTGKLDPLAALTGAGSPDALRSLIDFQLNGVNIDVRYKSPLNYGQLIVIMNEANEVLCVDKRNIIRIKGKYNLVKTDKICFKMVDLRVMSNPSEIRYGEPVWFQAVETPEPGASVDSNFFSSSVLGCKIFQLATIATQQLNENWADPKNKQREEIFKREEEVDSDEEYDRRMEEIAKKEKAEKEALEAATLRPKSKGRGWGALKKAPVKETLEKVKKVDKKLEQKKREEDQDEQADNKDLVGEVCGASIAVRLAHNTEGGGGDAGMINEVVSKEAINLGLFVPLSADNMNSKDEIPQSGSVVCSNRRIYLCQDLYCLANSVGSSYVPWPLHARDFSSETVHHASTLEGEGHGVQSGVAISQQAHHGKSMKHPSKQRGKRGKREKNMDGDFGVLRKVVKRGDEYEFAVDRKCVWRLCHVDNLSDAHQMTTAELTTMKVMATAKEKLRKSEIRRKGGKTYEGSNWVPPPDHARSTAEGEEDETKPLATSPSKARIPGGEKFSHALRSDVSSHLLTKESEILASRREKEQVLKSFVESQVSNWDPPGTAAFPEDLRSMRSQMSFEYIAPNVHMEIGSQGGNDDASLGSSSQCSEEESTIARIMLPVGHEQAYMQAQKAILKKKTLGLRSYHYQQYPHFYKSPQKATQPSGGQSQPQSPRTLSPLELSKTTFRKHFPFNAGLISPGERVLALRQAFDGIERHEIDTLAANGGVDDSVEKKWKATGESSDVNEGKEGRPGLSTTGGRRNNGFESDDEEDEESKAKAARQLIIAKKIKILNNEDDLMWAAAKHRRKIEAARLVEESMKNMDEEERKNMEELLRVRRASMASMGTESALTAM